MFRRICVKYLEPIFMFTIIFGIIFLSQPWSEFLHRYGFTVTLIGLVGFIIFSHVKPLEENRER